MIHVQYRYPFPVIAHIIIGFQLSEQIIIRDSRGFGDQNVKKSIISRIHIKGRK